MICVISNKNKIKFTEKLVVNFYSFENWIKYYQLSTNNS